MTTQIPPNKSDTFFYAKQMHNYADSGEIIDQILPCNKKAFCEHHQEDVFQILSTNHKIIGELFHNTVK